MRISYLVFLSILGIANATSINGEKIQHHMNNLDKLRLVKNSLPVVRQRRKLDQGNNGGYQYQDQGNGNGYYTQTVSEYYTNEQNEDEQNEFEIDGSYSIKFEQCISLKTLNEQMINNVDEGLNMKAGADFVLFKAIDRYGKETEFAVDIATFVESLVPTIPNDREQYCEVCEGAFDTCEEQKELAEWNAVVANTGNMGNYYAYNSKQGYVGMEAWGTTDDGGYGDNSRQMEEDAEDTTEYIDCETCDSYGCFDTLYRQKAAGYYKSYDDDNQDDLYAEQGSYANQYESKKDYYSKQGYAYDEEDEINMEAALDWLTELGECKELNVYTNSNANYAQYRNNGKNSYYQKQKQNPYAGLMCNRDGSGMEIGIFLDDECTVYDSTRVFKNMLKSGSPQQTYYEMTRGLIEYTFTQNIECKQPQYAEPDWDARDSYAYQEGGEYDNERNYEAYYESQNQYYQDQTDAYYAYYQEGSGEEAIESCQQLFADEYVQLNVACNAQQAQQNYQNSNYNMTAPYQQYRYQSYYYDVTDPTDMDQVCTAMKLKRANGGFDTIMTQSRFSNMYNYKLYSAKITWSDYKSRISEGAQNLKYRAGEKFRQFKQSSWKTILLNIFLIACSSMLVFGIYKVSGRFSERLQYYQEQQEAKKDISQQRIEEIESFEFFEETDREPSGKRLRIDYPTDYNFT
eukprot:scaffold2261_cov124-Cylindrotheca_fusiformis.AAC.17